MATYATATDVTNRWGQVIDDQAIITLIETRLADVERMIKRRITDLDSKISAGSVDVEDVKQVEADAVLRIARNPDGYVSESDGNYTYMLSQSLSAGKLEILPEEWAILGLTNDGMFIIIPTPVVSS